MGERAFSDRGAEGGAETVTPTFGPYNAGLLVLGVFLVLKFIRIRRMWQAYQMRWSTLFFGTLAFLALFGFLHLLAAWLHPSH